jgi:hypothetical protein
MAYSTENQNIVCGQRTAGANLTANQFSLVKLSAAGTVALVTARTDEVYGVLSNAPALGEDCRVVLVGITKVNCGATVAEGALVGALANGQIGTAPRTGGTADIPILGSALIAGVDGDIITVQINCTNPPLTAA